MILVLCVVLGLLLFALWMVWAFWLPKRFKKVLDPKPVKHKFYGHPYAPVPYLRKRLPKPPDSYVWEVLVKYDDKGEAWLVCRLLNVITGQAQEKSKSLVRRSYEAYAVSYRRYSYINKNIFADDLIGPLLDWANALVNRIVNANQEEEYTIG